MLKRVSIAVVCWASVLMACAAAEPPAAGVAPAADVPQETKDERDARMAWFREAKFGMFIHWGLYSVPAGEWKNRKDYGEWILEHAKIPVSEYEKFRDQFNPVKFDARQWVSAVKDAGMKYIVITSKHHDGFAMFDSKLTDWDIMSTPFKRDPLKELSEACKDAGIKFCLYHSIMDWHHPDYLPRRAQNDVANAAGQAEFARYVAFMKGQLKELLTNYGPLGILWCDGEWEGTWTHELGKDLLAHIRGLQPNIIVNNRVGKNRQGMQGLSRGTEILGDYGTPEQEIPPNGLPGVDWESCMTMNDHWGYNKLDQNWRSSATLIRTLIEITSKGGNYLLNVGPTAEGVIPGPTLERLAEMGRWLKVNTESIHGTTANPFATAPAWGKVTQRPGKLYLHVFDWPKNGKLLVPVTNKVKRAYLLASSKEDLATTTGARGVELSLPAIAPDPIATVVAVEIEGVPAVVAPVMPVSQGKPVTVSDEWKGRAELQKAHINDGNTDTIWAGPENSRTGWAQIDLGEERVVDGALVSEGPVYTRCGKFEVQAQIGGEWKTVFSDTGIGKQRDLSFAPVKARLFRLTVAVDMPAGMPHGEPVIAEFQLFGV